MKILAKLAEVRGEPVENGNWYPLREKAFAETTVWLNMKKRRYVSDPEVPCLIAKDDGMHLPPETFRKLIESSRVEVEWVEGRDEYKAPSRPAKPAKPAAKAAEGGGKR